jgi:hypothetical protein
MASNLPIGKNEQREGTSTSKRKKTNLENLRRKKAQVDRTPLQTQFIGSIIEGKRQGNQGRGQPQLNYINQIVEYSGCQSYTEMKRKTSDRRTWRTTNQSQD